MAEANFGRVEIEIFKKKLNFNFSELRPAYLHIALHYDAQNASIAVFCVRSDRAHAACSTQSTPVW